MPVAAASRSVPSIPPITIAPPRLEPNAATFDGIEASNGDDIELRFVRDLWQAALGTGEDRADDARAATQPMTTASLDSLLSAQMMALGHGGFFEERGGQGYSGPLDLGRNAVYGEAIDAAARRTGLSPALLASIISAEASSQDGVWDAHSRNPRSSAAGLTQFLAGTWESETERAGTWLNQVASANGWLDAAGRVTPAARPALLDLRYDPEASIQAAADFAKGNLSALSADGLVPRGASNETLAKMAYLAHHLGIGDAARFLGGGISEARARMLLEAQIGPDAAEARIAEAGGSCAGAHRLWLTDYIDRKIDPARFSRA